MIVNFSMALRRMLTLHTLSGKTTDMMMLFSPVPLCTHHFSTLCNTHMMTGKSKSPIYLFLTCNNAHGSVVRALLVSGLHHVVCLLSTPIIVSGILQKRILRLILRGREKQLLVGLYEPPRPQSSKATVSHA